MAKYADGYVIVIADEHLSEYKKIASKASKVWMDNGALSYCETVLEDNNEKFGVPFTKLAKAKESERVIFAWITFKSRAQRDKVNAAVMKDKRMKGMMETCNLLDMKRFSYGGFDVLIEK